MAYTFRHSFTPTLYNATTKVNIFAPLRILAGRSARRSGGCCSKMGVHIEMRHLLPSPERAGLGLAAACHTLNDMRGSIRHRSLRYGKAKLD
jgi:hypothetical protein